MEKRLSNGDFLFLPMLLASSIKDQRKRPKILCLGGQCLDRVKFRPKPFDFNNFSLKLTRY